MNTVQQNAINLANQLINVCQQLNSIKIQIDQIVDDYNKEQIGTVWAAMQTAPLNADGSISSTPDGTPNTAHPIIVGGINKSDTQLVSGMTMIEQLQNFFNDVAVVTSLYLQTIRDLSNVN